MKHIAVLAMIILASGCTLARVNVEMLSERTALENQVLGSYNSLDSQMLLTASVRGVDAEGQISAPPRQSREFADSISAMQALDFHADDLEAFKRLGWAGENRQGLIEPFGITKDAPPPELKDFAQRYSAKEFEFVVSRINAARKVLMQQVIYMNENLSESDLPEVGRIFAGMYAEKAAPGEKIQNTSGAWEIKK